MRNKRKWLTLLLAAVLALSLSVPALAAEAAPGPEEIAVEFMALLDQDGIDYSDQGIDSDGDYAILIRYPGTNKEVHEINLYVDSSGLFFSAYEWYLLNYDETRLDEVLETMNDMNTAYRFVTFLADTSDSTITAKTFSVLQGDAKQSADILYYAYDYLPIIVDHAWEELTAGVPGSQEIPAAAQAPAAAPAAVSMAGIWYFSSLEMDQGGEKLSITADLMGTREFFVLTLLDDGTAELATMGEDETSKGSWTQEGDTGSVEMEGDAVRLFLLDENTLQMDATEELGFILTMVRDAA